MDLDNTGAWVHKDKLHIGNPMNSEPIITINLTLMKKIMENIQDGGI